MCEEESDDTEAVAKLFEINDSIHRTLERYRLVQKGDLEAASRIPKGTLGMTGAGVSKGPDNELSLIDLGTEESTDNNPSGGPPTGAAGASAASAQTSSLENDLLGLSIGPDTQSAGGQISLGGMSMAPPLTAQNANQTQQQQQQQRAAAAAAAATRTQLPLIQPQQQQTPQHLPNYNALSSLTSTNAATPGSPEPISRALPHTDRTQTTAGSAASTTTPASPRSVCLFILHNLPARLALPVPASHKTAISSPHGLLDPTAWHNPRFCPP